MAKPPPSRRDRALRAKTARDYHALVDALQALERTITAPAVKRQRTWRRDTRRSLATVVGWLQEHCESTEGPGGLLRTAEERIGRFQELSQARRDHARLLRDAANLLGDLDEYATATALPYNEFRRRAAQLISALRLHQAREADVLMLAFQLDLGVGD